MKKERNTEQKEKLIKYLQANNNKHLSIQEIHENLQNEIGMTTIYRIINSLIEKGDVTKIPVENSQGYCYRYNSKNKKCSEHYHLICEKCNNLIHFESTEVEKVSLEAQKNADFEIDNSRIVFFGICKNCRENKKD